MNGYTIGFIIEGALALILIIALIAVIAKKKKAPAAEAAGENAEETMPQAAEESAEREKADAVSGEMAVAELAAALPEEELGNRISFAANERSFSEAYIRRVITVAAFKLENDLLRDYRRNSEAAGAFRQKETEIYVTDDNAMEAACAMVDLMLEQYEKERQEAIERRRAKRAALRAEREAKREQAAQEKRAEAENPEISAKAAETEAETSFAEGEKELP